MIGATSADGLNNDFMIFVIDILILTTHTISVGLVQATDKHLYESYTRYRLTIMFIMIYATFVEIFVPVSLTEKKVPGPGYFISIFWAFFFQIQLLNTIILR